MWLVLASLIQEPCTLQQFFFFFFYVHKTGFIKIILRVNYLTLSKIFLL